MTKRILGRKEFISATLLHHGPSLKKLKQGKNLEAGVYAKAMEQYCLLACWACFLIEPRAIAQERHHQGLSSSPSIIKKVSYS
jgi:hypothetical protein